MSVLQYWQRRLVEKNPIYSEAFRIDKVGYRENIEDPTSTWPRAVARAILFDDYVAWFTDVYLEPYRKSDQYKDFPEIMPRPCDELTFYSTISPWVYIVGKKQQVRTYLVPTRVHHKGDWRNLKINKYFIRLCAWEAHVAAFELNVGIDIGMIRTDTYYLDRHQVVANAITKMQNQIDKNRVYMDRSMGR